ncbi:MAG: type II CAAX endopeptidase family protein [Bacteroidales bacterium]
MMKKIIQANPIVWFIIITFLFSWGLWMLMILSSKGLLPFYFPTNFLGSFGPAVGAIIVVWVSKGKPGIKKLFKSLFQWKSPFKTYLFAFCLIVLIYGLSIFITFLISPSAIEFKKTPNVAELIIYFFIVLIFGGPLGEEIGWRGFLQPQLQKKYNPFLTTLIIAVIWFLWHIPLFWLEGAAQAGESIPLFAVTVFTMTFLFTWLYIQSNGSLLLAILFHTSINFISGILVPEILPSIENNKTFNTISISVMVLITLLFVAQSSKQFLIKKSN